MFSGLHEIDMITNPDIALNRFYDIVNNTLSNHAPLREKRVKRDHQPDWFTDDILATIHDRDKCRKSGKIDQYKILRNKACSMIKRSKKDFFNDAIRENKNQTYLWKNLKDVTNLNKANSIIMPQRIINNDSVIDGSLNILNELNRHFVNISHILDRTAFVQSNFSKMERNLNEKLCNYVFEIKYITPYEIRKIIDKLDTSKATGLDGIGPKILKHCGDVITPSLASIINKSIQHGMFPDKLKLAKVLPILKSGNKDDPNNYRPISILPTVSKIFERHIATQMQIFFEKTNIIHKTQSGFRKHHSCHTALLRLINAWLEDVDSGKLIGTIFLDLRKAFDLVDHEILIHKLKMYHFSSNSVELFKSYLANRTQIVKVGNMQSEELKVTSGVPQGSILGPLLFILYINDLAFMNPSLNIDLYADDSTVYESGFQIANIENKLQDNINYIIEWCMLNNMALHPLKSKCMLIGSTHMLKRKGNLNLYIKDIKLESVYTQKLLGVHIDNTLNWHTQIDHVCKTLNKKIALLKRIIYFLTPEMKTLFYNAYILPVFDYCCLVWGIGSHTYINKIASLQKRIARVILNKPNRSSSSGLFKDLSWLSFFDRCKYNSAVLTFKVLNDMTPSYIKDMVSFSENNVYNLRSITNKDLVLRSSHRTNYMKSSFVFYSRNVWNSIPLEIRNATNIKSFKEKIKQYLMGTWTSGN